MAPPIRKSLLRPQKEGHIVAPKFSKLHVDALSGDRRVAVVELPERVRGDVEACGARQHGRNWEFVYFRFQAAGW